MIGDDRQDADMPGGGAAKNFPHLFSPVQVGGMHLRNLAAVRDAVGTGITLGVRMNLRQELPGGLTSDDAIATAQYLESTGLIGRSCRRRGRRQARPGPHARGHYCR